MNLLDVQLDNKVRIVSIECNVQTRLYLEELGLYAGNVIEVKSKDFGNMILEVFDSRLAVNEDIASKIIVENLHKTDTNRYNKYMN